MRRMTSRATFNFRFVLVNERPLFFRVAFVANLVSGRVGPQLFRSRGAMRTVAIVALDKSFVHAVMEGSREFGAHAHVACVTKVRRLGLHQVLALFGLMGRMAIVATDAVR